MKILIAVDSSPSSKEALRQVAARTWPDGSAASVLSVVDIGFLGGLIDSGPLLNSMTEAAEQLVKADAQLLAGTSLPTTTAVTVGHPSSSIVEYARQVQSDFIYLGSHGRRGLTRFLLGSVSKAVVHGAGCSVGIIRARPSNGTADGAGSRLGLRVLLATDGSNCSIAAANSIAARQWPPGSQFRIISVADIIEAGIEPWYTDVGLLEELQRLNSQNARQAIDSAQDVLTAARLVASKAALTGLPKAAILDDAQQWNADLIVVGSHGRRGVDRVLLGSVSESIAVHAHCSVEVIR
jgi:nucleotide-binding universal stress UspA family protein